MGNSRHFVNADWITATISWLVSTLRECIVGWCESQACVLRAVSGQLECEKHCMSAPRCVSLDGKYNQSAAPYKIHLRSSQQQPGRSPSLITVHCMVGHMLSAWIKNCLKLSISSLSTEHLSSLACWIITWPTIHLSVHLLEEDTKKTTRENMLRWRGDSCVCVRFSN